MWSGCLPELPHDNLQRASDRDGDDREYEGAKGAPDPAPDRCSDEDGQENEEGIDPHRLAHDHWIEHMILEEGVDEEHDSGGDAGGQRVACREKYGRNPRQGPADDGNEVDERDPKCPQKWKWNAEQHEGDEYDDARDERRQQISEHVPDHRTVHLASDLLVANRALGRYEAEQSLSQLGALEEQQHYQREDRE